MDQDRTKRKLTSIFSADVVGYSRLMELDEAWTIQSLEENKRLISKLIEEYQGRVIDAPGDNLLAEFSSVINAVECAVKIQHDLKKKNDNLIESRRMHFRIGVNLGDVVEEDGRIYGNGVNIAARLEGLTDPGGICISRRTYDVVKTRLDLGYEYIGEHNVKNISEPVRVYRVLMGSENAGKVIGEKKASKMVSRRLAMTTIIALILIAAGSLIWMYSHQSGKIEKASGPEQASVVIDVAEASKTIAVLPFEDLSPEKDQEYFVDGLIEELLNSLAKIPDLLVTARTSSFTFKESDKTAQEIAGILGVAHVLEGSVRKAGDKLRVTAQLIRAADGFHLWSNTYDGELKDIFKVQEEIATAVANELRVKLGVGGAFKELGGTENEKAYELYLITKGYYRTPPLDDRALESINAAIELDPGFALAWALKSRIHQGFAIQMTSSEQAAAALSEGIDAAQRAIELEPNMPDGYSALGTIKSNTGRWAEAGTAFRKAFKLTTEVSSSSEIFAAPHYECVGYLQKAKENLEGLLLNDPLNANYRSWYLDCFGFLNDRKQAEEEYKRARSLFADNEFELYLMDLAITFVRVGVGDVMSPEDILVSDSMTDMIKENLDSQKVITENLRRINADGSIFMQGSIGNFACYSAYFGGTVLALDAIEKSVQASFYDYVGYIWLPVFHEVRQLPRFKEFVREIGLVDYWEKFGWPDLCRPTEDGDFVCD